MTRLVVTAIERPYPQLDWGALKKAMETFGLDVTEERLDALCHAVRTARVGSDVVTNEQSFEEQRREFAKLAKGLQKVCSGTPGWAWDILSDALAASGWGDGDEYPKERLFGWMQVAKGLVAQPVGIKRTRRGRPPASSTNRSPHEKGKQKRDPFSRNLAFLLEPLLAEWTGTDGKVEQREGKNTRAADFAGVIADAAGEGFAVPHHGGNRRGAKRS